LTIEIGSKEVQAARSIFGDRLTLAERFVQHLATSGIERGLLGPRELPRLWDRHVLNCAVVGELIPDQAAVADVGSGAGLPGLALAIARPDASFVLIEPLERRVNWLHEVTEDLNLTNVKIFRGRAEQAVGKYDVNIVTARAVSALSGLASLTMPLLKGSGEVLAIKGRSAAEEVEKAAKIIRRLGGKSTSVETAGGSLLKEPTTVVRIVVVR
jgi:16S rRNA (guanine527-N7)-methyltransferase